MKIGVDLDSVLADIMSPLFNYHNLIYGTSFRPETHTNYDLTKVWNVDSEEVIKRVFEFYATPEFETIKPIAGAQNALKNISKTHRMYIITSRPDKYHHKTIKWIRNNFPDMFEDILCTNQVSPKGSKKTTKSQLCLKVGAQLMIEDHIDFAVDCAEAHIDVLLYDQPWNRQKKLHKNIKRMHSWDEIDAYISKV